MGRTIIIILNLFSNQRNSSAQIILSYESATQLNKSEVAISGSYLSGRFSIHGKSIFGVQLGFGASEFTELKLKYIRGNSKYGFPNEEIIELSAKFSIRKDELALLLPFTILFDDNKPTILVNPKYIITILSEKNFDLSISPGVLLNLDVLPAFLLSCNINTGLSTDLSKWAIRPELGIIYIPFFGGGLGTSFGVSFSFYDF